MAFAFAAAAFAAAFGSAFPLAIMPWESGKEFVDELLAPCLPGRARQALQGPARPTETLFRTELVQVVALGPCHPLLAGAVGTQLVGARGHSLDDAPN